MKNITILMMALVFILISACTSTTNLGTAGAERKQFFIVPQKLLTKQADRSYQQFIHQAKDKQLLIIDPKLDQVLNKLKKNAEFYRQGSSQWDWQVSGNLNKDLNAHGFPSGKIVINTGLYWSLKLNEDELAFVMAHEMAHALRDHHREKISLLFASQVAMISSTAGIGTLATAASSVTGQAVFLPKVSKFELEADVLALDLMSKAGFDPNAALSFWQKYQQETTRRQMLDVKPLMTQDSIDKRKIYIEKYLPEMHIQFQQAQAVMLNKNAITHGTF
ncbi:MULTISPECIES: M48 family metallopeptidase [unclassified Acinetobacter]|uniref:M48 family metallopeptidase n=1 Tax=unclassified Acinetobacter TaxID=196816 RepID=UPI0015D273F0|nr:MULTISPECIES: M48 family metallopeptidase [unclassified Acinetobacter]